MKKTLGGDRLGSGNKMAVNLHNFGRSSHNVGFLFKTDQAIGTIVPYMCDIILNGTTYETDITTKIRTLPTNAPIFGSFKHQIDVFAIPFRLYIAALHNNALGIGRTMNKVYLPIKKIRFNQPDFGKKGVPERQQISPDSLQYYLGIASGGKTDVTGVNSWVRSFPATFDLAYWDIYKNYYANKQEEIGYAIQGSEGVWLNVQAFNRQEGVFVDANAETNQWSESRSLASNDEIRMSFRQKVTKEVFLNTELNFEEGSYKIKDIVYEDTVYDTFGTMWAGSVKIDINTIEGEDAVSFSEKGVAMKSFELSLIDEMREKILAAPKTSPFEITGIPYTLAYGNATVNEKNKNGNAAYFTQSGLGIRTYLSDRFNNWLSTEWIDGVNGVNEISAVDVSNGKLTMDALILSKKIFEMMNRIAIAGGSYDDWQEAVYGVKRVKMSESPIFIGGFSSEIVFDEVVSNSAAETSAGIEPLGSLAGRGIERNAQGGRSIKIKADEPMMIMVLGSFVPRIDYSQGNMWWNRLETMDDFHKPNLDAIGFQELLTEEFASIDTTNKGDNELEYHSVGKQPSWIEYMTRVNISAGSFAAGEELSFMALNREYHYDEYGNVKDATTYIDPTIYNNAFADTKLSAKNIWVQVAFDSVARRRMSAKQIPNL